MQDTFLCRNCNRMHVFGQCYARNKQCLNCGRLNHFRICCRSVPSTQ
jgi:hypothetical protein